MGIPGAVRPVYRVGMSRQGRRRTSVPPRTVIRPAGRARARARGKRAFDVDEIFTRIDEAIRPFDKAAMFELKERGHGTLFEQLVACVGKASDVHERHGVAKPRFADARIEFDQPHVVRQ